MKIDVHVHTKKIKQGDAESRNVTPERFSEIINLTDVKILAVTNHNHFDLNQYNQLRTSVEGVCQVWPGVELDILENGNKAHLLVIVDPANAEEFSERVDRILNGFTPDNFKINLADTVKTFEELTPVYIAHYKSKTPNLLDADLETLLKLVPNEKRILKEAANSISTGIYISHGHNSIYGSDVHNWDEYQQISKTLPELRLPVDSFEQFGLLLEKDEATINTILNKKSKETIQLNPFNNAAEVMDLDVYNDINIIFGSKGTGKTDILRALSKYYNDIGFKTTVYESNALKLEQVHDLRGNNFSTSVSHHGIDECKDELAFIRSATEKAVTRLTEYHQYYLIEETNRISKDLKVKDLISLDENASNRRFQELFSSQKKMQQFKRHVDSDRTLSEVVGEELVQELVSLINRIGEKLQAETDVRFTDYKSISLFNSLIRIFTQEIARKTGQPEKPLKTGFQEYASNRIQIERCITKILTNISTAIRPKVEYVGHLGEKGDLYCQTNLVIQDGQFVNSDYSPVSNGVTKNPQKYVATKLKIISKHIYSNELFEKIRELNDEIDYSETVMCLTDLLLFNRHFTVNSAYYEPSNGESSMVLLHNELSIDKDIYIIDEPEKSLGNDYISDVIVPLLKEQAQRGKKIIIATHDANIAVRTLPYNSIYRGHDARGYFTFKGNPFSNSLKCLLGERSNLDWKRISMKTLEGGQQAFGERGKIYGEV
jgi:predicted ATPase